MPIGVAASLAIVYEVSAPKPGNVHRGADFEDVTYVDFITGAVVIGPIVERAALVGVGKTVLDAVRATRDAVGTNTNLGTLLLLAPLAVVPQDRRHADGIGDVLRSLTFEDTQCVYQAIRDSSAGGLGRAEEADVSSEPPAELTLVDAMSMASGRDLVARQYCDEFADVFRIAACIEEGVNLGWSLNAAIVHAQIRQMMAEADSLILRKCGHEIAEHSRAIAGRVFESGGPGEEAYERGLEDFDFWLRSDGHRRNPGTTADLIAAALFVLLREGRVNWKQ